MGSDKKGRVTGPAARGSGQTRLDEKRRRFAEERQPRSTGLKLSTIITLGAIVVVAAFAVFMVARNDGGASVASAATIQQTATTAATAENGSISIPLDEVRAKKIVYWDYKKADGKTVPLMAYVAPSGGVKLAVRICEPCNGFSFRIEGGQIVCNVCGTRWDLETLKGVSGGCQGYPPDVLKSTTDGGKISVDEATVLAWKARI